MDGGLLSLKWNNHRSTFFYVLSNVRKKECYTDVTLACDGKFYPVHKLVLSTCSEYFEQMFEQTQCKHPVIVLKDIRSEELESLLSYMYVGEVNVVQEKLSGLIKAAECLRIKGLAVPDEEPCSKTSTSREKRSSDNSLNSEPKRRRQDDSGNTSSFRQAHSNNRNDDRRKSLDHPSSSTSNKFRNTNSSNNNNVNSNRPSSGDRESGDRGTTSSRAERLASPASNNQHSAAEVKSEELAETSEAEAPDEVTIDEPNEPVKQEPVDLDAVYLSDSNSATEAKDILMDNFGDSDGQQHFMDELLGQNSGSDQGNMGVGDYSEGGEGSSSAPSGAGGQQQQHMVTNDESSSTREEHHHPSMKDFFATIRGAAGGRPITATSNKHGGFRRHHSTTDHLGVGSNYYNPYKQCGEMAASSDRVWFGPSHASSSDAVGVFADPDQANLPSTSSGKFSSKSNIDLLKSPYNYPTTGDTAGESYSSFDAAREGSNGGGAGSGKEMFVCSVCYKVFHFRSYFVRHCMTHTGERPHSCPHCSYSTALKGDLNRHIRKKHTEMVVTLPPSDLHEDFPPSAAPLPLPSQPH